MNDKTLTAEPEPAAQQFQGRDGAWHNFVDERHFQNTVEDGSWPLRNLYTQEAIDTLRAQLAKLNAENEQLREQRNRIGLCIGHALSGGRKDDHEAGLSERMNAIRALIAERNEWQASRIAYANEFPLNADGEPDVVNVHANIRSLKAQLAEAQRDAERWRWLKDHARIFRQSPDMSGNHYWMVHATTTLRGPTLDAAIDAAKGEPS